MDDKDNRLLWNVLEVKYLKMFGREISCNPNDSYDLFPLGWYLDIDVDTKIKILLEALENNKKIVDTSLYQDMLNERDKRL